MSSLKYTTGVAEPLNVVITHNGKNADIRGHTFVATFTNSVDENDVVTPAISMHPGMAGVFIDTANLVADSKRWKYLIVGTDVNGDEYHVLSGNFDPV